MNRLDDFVNKKARNNFYDSQLQSRKSIRSKNGGEKCSTCFETCSAAIQYEKKQPQMTLISQI